MEWLLIVPISLVLLVAWCAIDEFFFRVPEGALAIRRGILTYHAEVVLDSIAPNGVRLTTFLVILPKWLLAELNTHRSFSRNASSSRAMTTMHYIKQVIANPVIPIAWGRRKATMQAGDDLPTVMKLVARQIWLQARWPAVLAAYLMMQAGLHKQWANRVLEPWVWAQDVVTATEYQNFIRQRVHADAQPEMEYIARRFRDLLYFHYPAPLLDHQWHLPFIRDDERDLPLEWQIKASVARCARASQFHAGGERSIMKDLSLYERLYTADPKHVSPFEHVAHPAPEADCRSGNFQGWIQYRSYVEKCIENGAADCVLSA